MSTWPGSAGGIFVARFRVTSASPLRVLLAHDVTRFDIPTNDARTALNRTGGGFCVQWRDADEFPALDIVDGTYANGDEGPCLCVRVGGGGDRNSHVAYRVLLLGKEA